MNNDTFSRDRRRWLATCSVLTLFALARPVPGRSADAPRTLLVLGDSLSAEYGLARGTGWVALLEQRLAEQAPGWTVINASISGETTAGGESRISELLTRYSPALVVVELGANDALRGLDLASTQKNLDRIIAAAQKAGAQVLLLGMMVPPNYGSTYTDAFGQLFKDLAAARKVPLVPFLLDGIADHSELFQADRLHPNQRAQPMLLDNVWPALEPLLRTVP